MNNKNMNDDVIEKFIRRRFMGLDGFNNEEDIAYEDEDEEVLEPDPDLILEGINSRRRRDIPVADDSIFGRPAPVNRELETTKAWFNSQLSKVKQLEDGSSTGAQAQVASLLPDDLTSARRSIRERPPHVKANISRNVVLSKLLLDGNQESNSPPRVLTPPSLFRRITNAYNPGESSTSSSSPQSVFSSLDFPALGEAEKSPRHQRAGATSRNKSQDFNWREMLQSRNVS